MEYHLRIIRFYQLIALVVIRGTPSKNNTYLSISYIEVIHGIPPENNTFLSTSYMEVNRRIPFTTNDISIN